MIYYGKLAPTCDGCELVIGHVDGPFNTLGVRGAKRGCLAIGAVKQGISGGDTGIRRRFDNASAHHGKLGSSYDGCELVIG